MLINHASVQGHGQALVFHVDGGAYVGVHRLGRYAEPLAEEIDPTVVPDKANQVIAAVHGLGQRVLRRRGLVGEAQRHGAGRQDGIGGPAAQLAVPVVRVVPILEGAIGLVDGAEAAQRPPQRTELPPSIR